VSANALAVVAEGVATEAVARAATSVRVSANEGFAERELRRAKLWDRVSRGLLAPSGAGSHPWGLDQLTGRLVELSGKGAAAPLTLAFRKVVEAQERAEPVAWVTDDQVPFYPPDASANGVDLDALPVVFVADAPAAARTAEKLGRSGAFGLVVLDLRGPRVDLPLPLQTRLASLAKAHDMAILCLTEKGAEQPSLGSLVSLRCDARRERVGEGRYVCHLQAVKDKRQGPGWRFEESCSGPVGLC